MDQSRNLNPHREAFLAMLVFSKDYAAQGGGCMDFHDRLPEARKRELREWAKRIADLPPERTPHDR